MQDERIFILSKLPVYTGKVNVISEDQTVRDIINGVKYCHNKYSGDYDKIGDYFIKNTPSFKTPITVPFISTISINKINDILSLSLPVRLLDEA